MKKLKYIFIAFSLLGVVSCDDFFETKTPSALGSSVFNIKEQTASVVAGIYNCYYEDKSYRNRLNWIIGNNTDIEYSNKTGTSYEQLSRYNMITSNSEVSNASGKDCWGYLTSATLRASSVIDGLEQFNDLTEATFRYFLGEAYVLRAWTMFEMVKIWGDIPVLKSSTEINIKKSDRNEAYEQIISDLEKSLEYIQWSSEIPSELGFAQNNIGRPSKEFACGLLAKVCLHYAGYSLRPDVFAEGGCATASVRLNVAEAAKRQELYTKAMNACKAVIDRHGVDSPKMKAEFADVFKDLCADKVSFSDTEYLWVIPFANGTRGQFMNYNCPKSANALKALKNNDSGSTNSINCVVPTFIFDFDNADKRKWVTVAPFEWTADKNANGISDDVEKNKIALEDWDGTSTVVYQKKHDIHQIYNGKYRVEWMSRDRGGNDDGIDYPIMRYADVLLMYAEACIGGVTGDAPAGADMALANQCLTKIRTRAGLGAVELNMDNIIKERAFEFCGEYIRKWDLMRWGILKTKLVEATNRIQALDKHEGEFASTGDTLYFKYKKNDELLYAGGGAVHAYEMDSVYGLALGENSRPATFDAGNGWLKKSIMQDEKGVRRLSTYNLYVDENLIDLRHYWPIFDLNVSASDGTLWNDYGY